VFDWVAPLYQERLALGKDRRGHLLKLALNSIYGKLAQRSGSAPYHDAAAAGLITAMTRARIIEAIAHNPKAVFAVATDALFAFEPLPLDIGDDLGQWERKIWHDLFIVRSGVYWSPSNLKTLVKSRGAPRFVIEKAASGGSAAERPGAPSRRFVYGRQSVRPRRVSGKAGDARLGRRQQLADGLSLRRRRSRPYRCVCRGAGEPASRPDFCEWRTGSSGGSATNSGHPDCFYGRWRRGLDWLSRQHSTTRR
jgi:hypothetical protein